MLQNHATLAEIRKYLQKELAEIYSEGESRALLNIILEHLGHPSPEAFLHPDLEPGSARVAQINEIVREIHTLRPIQYILGSTTFHDLTIHIDENALIPRPETEEMVQLIIRKMKDSPTNILDLCTGSGCIALALKKEFPEAMVSGLDNSRPALKLARINGEKNQLEVQWLQEDVLHIKASLLPAKYDLVLSNPPYVLESEKAQMDKNVLDFEPHAALFVEEKDPLLFYRAISQLAPEILSPGGSVWLEINERFGAQVASLMIEAGFSQTIIHKDIHEKERFIEARS